MSKNSENLLTNVYVLYFVSAVALLDLFYLIMSSDFTFVAIFILVGFLTTFFSKNMVVIFCIAAAVTNVVKYGHSVGVEGLENPAEKEEKTQTHTDSSNNEVSGTIKEIDPKLIAKQLLEQSKTLSTEENMEPIHFEKLNRDEKDPKAYTDAGDDTAILNKQAQKLLLEAEKLTEQHNVILEKMQNIGNSALGGFLGIAAGDKNKN